MLAQKAWPEFPTPIGVLRRVEAPTFERRVVDQIDHAIEQHGQGNLEALLYSGDLWTVEEDGAVTRASSPGDAPSTPSAGNGSQ